MTFGVLCDCKLLPASLELLHLPEFRRKRLNIRDQELSLLLKRNILHMSLQPQQILSTAQSGLRNRALMILTVKGNYEIFVALMAYLLNVATNTPRSISANSLASY
jgi:hypothetical protein